MYENPLFNSAERKATFYNCFHFFNRKREEHKSKERMGILLSKVWSMFSSTKTFKLVVVGLNNAGKTSILYALQLKRFVETQPTIGGNVEEVQYKNLNFLMWDLGGQQQLREAWSMYYAKTDAVILVVDSTEPERFSTVRDELIKMLGHPDLANAPVLIFANKQDLSGALRAEEVVASIGVPEVAGHERPWTVMPCSALTQQGLAEGMAWIAERVNK